MARWRTPGSRPQQGRREPAPGARTPAKAGVWRAAFRRLRRSRWHGRINRRVVDARTRRITLRLPATTLPLIESVSGGGGETVGVESAMVSVADLGRPTSASIVACGGAAAV
jgi:hypothetical protein